MKPFTTLAGLMLLLVAATHAYRVFAGWPVMIDGQSLPLWVSYVGIAVPAFLAVMLFVEARR